MIPFEGMDIDTIAVHISSSNINKAIKQIERSIDKLEAQVLVLQQSDSLVDVSEIKELIDRNRLQRSRLLSALKRRIKLFHYSDSKKSGIDLPFHGQTKEQIAENNTLKEISRAIHDLKWKQQKATKIQKSLKEIGMHSIGDQIKGQIEAIDIAVQLYNEAKQYRQENIKRLSNIRKFHLEIAERNGKCCHYCGKQLTKNDRSIDHKIPKCFGGETTLENCVLSCKTCNTRKAAMLYEEFLEVMAQAS